MIFCAKGDLEKPATVGDGNWADLFKIIKSDMSMSVSANLIGSNHQEKALEI